jgi:hypothetical protein
LQKNFDIPAALMKKHRKTPKRCKLKKENPARWKADRERTGGGAAQRFF